MKVTCTQEKLTVDFEKLLDYKIFLDEDGWIYLKIPTVIDEKRHGAVNAIDLKNDYLTFFEDDDKIKVMDAEIIIQN